MKRVRIVERPYARSLLSELRKSTTKREKFRTISGKLFDMLIEDAIEEGDMRIGKVRTPVGVAVSQKVAKDFVVISILRSGIAMIPSVMKVLPHARIGFAGVVRDEVTAKPSEYYWKMPLIKKNSVILIVDPMLATGGTALHVLKRLEGQGGERRFVCAVASPEGISILHQAYPAIDIVTATVDEGLNSRKYIVPGLGDFGDRYFGTE